MSLKSFLYPLDLTGSLLSNRITEKHVIGTTQYRAFALRGGAFFTHNLSLMVNGHPDPLVRGEDYECVFYFDKIAKMTNGLEICGVIVITNPALGTDVTVIANIVGGPMSAAADLIAKAIEDLKIDNRNVYWQDIIDKDDLWQPPAHLHDLGDTFGFEYIISILSQIKDAILIGDHTAIEQLVDRLNALEQSLRASQTVHNTSYGNPHKVTNDQVNAYSKESTDMMIQIVNQALAVVNTQIADKQQQISSNDSDIVALISSLQTHATVVGQVTAENLRLNQLIADANNRITAQNDRIVVLSNQISAFTSTIVTINNRIDSSIVEIANIKTKNIAQDQRLDVLEP